MVSLGRSGGEEDGRFREAFVKSAKGGNGTGYFSHGYGMEPDSWPSLLLVRVDFIPPQSALEEGGIELGLFPYKWDDPISHRVQDDIVNVLDCLQ
jgi:hypothetical protein